MGWTGLDAHPTWHSLLGPPAAQWWMWCCDQAPGRDSLPPLTLLVCFRRKLRLVGTQSWEVLKVSESSKMSTAMRTNYRLYWVICWQNMFCAFKKCLCSTCVYHIWDDDSQTLSDVLKSRISTAVYSWDPSRSLQSSRMLRLVTTGSHFKAPTSWFIGFKKFEDDPSRSYMQLECVVSDLEDLWLDWTWLADFMGLPRSRTSMWPCAAVLGRAAGGWPWDWRRWHMTS